MNKFTCVRSLKGHTHNVSSVTFTPDGDYLISSSWDKTIKVWEVSTGFLVKNLEGHDDRINDVAVNEKGNLLVSSGNKGDVILWNTDWKRDNCLQSTFD